MQTYAMQICEDFISVLNLKIFDDWMRTLIDFVAYGCEICISNFVMEITDQESTNKRNNSKLMSLTCIPL